MTYHSKSSAGLRIATILFVFMVQVGFLQQTWSQGDKKQDTIPGSERTALDRYVATPDPNFTYSLVNTVKGEGFTTFILDMTSQSWRDKSEVDRTLWKHWVTIIKPDEIDTSTGLLFIGGGKNGGNPPSSADKTLVKVAIATKSVIAELKMVPNQPLKFPDEFDDRYKEEGRYEDELIAYTWDKYLKTGDELWPLRLPMVKSAVRAMDTVTLFCYGEDAGNITVDQFVVAGGSKRGWTTWMTAVVDPRVVGICPIVIDMLNLEKSFEHHWRAYGFWAPAVSDYVDMKLMKHMGTPKYGELMKLVEPYEYRSRLTMPKLMLNATGDQFFLPDSSQFYFDDLPSQKYLRYVPNADHGLDDTDAVETLAAFHYSVSHKGALPEFSWKFLPDGAIRVKTKDKPSEVRLWQATNPDARDFRLETLGKVWTNTVLQDEGQGTYTGRISEPEKGWSAFLVELTYPSDAGVPLKLTTSVRIIPDTLPFTYPPSE